MASILENIVEKTTEDLKKQKKNVSLRDLESFKGYEKGRLSLKESLQNREGISILAEIKKASPSKGVIRADFDPLKIADAYINHGASAISVLTDKPFFQGDLIYLEKISEISPIPLLCKDFIIDPYQIKEARAYGADAVLLIATITDGNQLAELLHAADDYGVEALLEAYSPEDVEKCNWSETPIFGVNNRNLNTFEVDLHRGIELLRMSPDQTVRVSESGLTSAEDLLTLYRNQIDAALIGEHFMSQPDPGRALSSMLAAFEQLKEKENQNNG
jgi:indole-3-glycerol phosphate synthase